MVRFSRWLWSQRSGTKVLLAVACALLLPPTFIPAIDHFAELTSGAEPFDTQLWLTPTDMHEQLRAWTPAAKTAYRRISIIDFVFPPTLGLALALSWAWLLARLPGDVGERVANRGLLALAFTSAVFDWTENVGNLLFIGGHSNAVVPALVAKYAKSTAVFAELIVTFILIGLAVRAAMRRRAT